MTAPLASARIEEVAGNECPQPPGSSALLTRLLALIPPSGEPALHDLLTISRESDGLDSAELTTLLTSLGHAVKSGRTQDARG